MKRIFTLLFMCLILLSTCIAQDEISYTEIDEATLLLNISSYFELVYEKSGSSVSSTNINLELYPITDYRQELLVLNTNGNEENNMIKEISQIMQLPDSVVKEIRNWVEEGIEHQKKGEALFGA